VPHSRPRKKGSFASDLEELVVLFPAHETSDRRPSNRSAELQEKIDIHARLFERAWTMDDR
jgi:hypothetical protein